MPSIPTHLRVKQQIREELSVWSDPAQWPTESQLQERYKVSRPTIRKALTALVAEGVLARVPGRRGFLIVSPDTMPQEAGLRIGHVAVANANLSGGLSLDPRMQLRDEGIRRVAERRNCRVLSGMSGLSVAGERAVVADLLAAGVQGLVISPLPRSPEEAETDYLLHENLGVPVVLSGMLPQGNPHAAVEFDHWQVGYDVTSWLLSQDHTRIGLLTRSNEVYYEPQRERLQGYQDAHHDRALPVDPALILALPPTLSPARRSTCLHTTLETLLDRWLALPQPPTALIALEDLVAIELIELLQQRGIRVPEDITVFGYGNLEIGRHFRPAFPTTAPDFLRMGELACTVLLNRMASGKLPVRTYVLPVPLLLRSTPSPSDNK